MIPNTTWPAVEGALERSSSLGGFQKQRSSFRPFLFYSNLLNNPSEVIHTLPLEKFSVKGFNNLYHICTIAHEEALPYTFVFGNTNGS